MTAFHDVQSLLDRSIGPGQIGAHRAFWRGLSRDQFVARSVYGYPLVTPGDSANSNLVKALRGEVPFGDDFTVPGVIMPRMPARLPPMPDEDIATIAGWIDSGCPEQEK